MNQAKPTREVETEIRYQQEARRLLLHYASSGHARSTEGFIDWFKEKSETIAKATWRLYKAALIFHFETERNSHEHGSATYQSYDDIINHVQSLEHPQTIQPARCSSKKQKFIKPDDMAKLLDELDKSRSTYARFAQLLLINGTVIGLRPHEWRSAALVASTTHDAAQKIGLRTRNGKQTNGRATGRFRTIWFSESFSKEQLRLIKELLIYIRDYELSKPTNWDKAYAGARKLLLRANRQCFPRRKRTIAFYSSRHQFSADLKNSQDLISIAALMGQLSAATPASHYGRKGNGSIRPKDLRVYPDKANHQVVAAHAELNARAMEKLRHPATQASLRNEDVHD